MGNEQLPEPQPAIPRPEAETPPISIEKLPQKLGFVETEEMARLRQLWTEARAAGAEQAGELRARYESLAVDLLDEITDSDSYAKAALGLNIATSLVWRDSGKTEKYIQELEDVLLAVANEGISPARPLAEWGFQDVYDCVQAEITRTKQAGTEDT